MVKDEKETHEIDCELHKELLPFHNNDVEYAGGICCQNRSMSSSATGHYSTSESTDAPYKFDGSSGKSAFTFEIKSWWMQSLLAILYPLYMAIGSINIDWM